MSNKMNALLFMVDLHYLDVLNILVILIWLSFSFFLFYFIFYFSQSRDPSTHKPCREEKHKVSFLHMISNLYIY